MQYYEIIIILYMVLCGIIPRKVCAFSRITSSLRLTTQLLQNKHYRYYYYHIEGCNPNKKLFCSHSTKINMNVEPISGLGMNGYVDVHAHLIHEKFEGLEDEVALRSKAAGLEYVIVNGLEPISNRAVLTLCERHSPYLLPAAGIYPLDAACAVIDHSNWNHTFAPPEKFDVDSEIDFIDQLAAEKKIIAIGECGMDKHYLKDDVSLMEQERVLRKLMKVAVKHSIPMILHTRKAEQKVFQMLQEEGVEKADFHCFCGKAKLGAKIAAAGYYLSIPSHVTRSDSSFRKLVNLLPFDKILTETDSPYMGAIAGEINEPSTVVGSIDTIAEIKGVSTIEARDIVRSNFRTLFGL